MAGSVYGDMFCISTWGESHGPAIGVVVDGCPAGLSLSEEDIQIYLNRRKPGQNKFTTSRDEKDKVEILSGVFEGITTGTPISMIVRNTDQRSKDYGNLSNTYRPGHADYTYDAKYGERDYRGGGRSSGRETIGRVAAGAIACKILKELGIDIWAYTNSIGPVEVDVNRFDRSLRDKNEMVMPDEKAALMAAEYLEEKIKNMDSAGGTVGCIISGLPAGIGEPVFEKLSANLAKAVMSIGAVKGFEIGSGMEAALSSGAINNDEFYVAEDGSVKKKTNHAGGILGGISDGGDIVFKAAFKPTPSISSEQNTVNNAGEEVKLAIKGRHDPVIVPRAVVVTECMAALCITDMLFKALTSRMDNIRNFYGKRGQQL